MNLITYLALGDSYTIGEAVPLHQNFPYQLVQILRGEMLNVAPPEIIAKTGWTTDELTSALEQHSFLPSYNLVTLLIGVNNQYRGKSKEEYKKEFEGLLQRSIAFANNNKDLVFVLSIPDYSVTPFAREKDFEKIAIDIDEFNNINRLIAEQYGVHYLYITDSTRLAKENAVLLAEDGLHPSAVEYKKWAELIASQAKHLLPKMEASF